MRYFAASTHDLIFNANYNSSLSLTALTSSTILCIHWRKSRAGPKINQTIYVENIEPFPSTYWRNNGAAGGLKVYAKNCKLRGLKAYGLDEIILESCTNPCKKMNLKRSWIDS